MDVRLHPACAGLLALLAVTGARGDELPGVTGPLRFAATDEASGGGAVPAPPAAEKADESPSGAQACQQPGSITNAWIDRMQRGVYTGVCGSAQWFDGLFGNPRFDQDSDATFGRIGVFETYDRRDKLETRLRLRARYALPALESRLRLTLGRGDEQELVEERPANSENPLPPSFQNVEDDNWLLGLGYSKQNELEDGFDFGVGVRLSSGLDPYVKATYRHNFIFSDATMLRFRETPFWRDSRGIGATTQVALDQLVSPTVLIRWNNTGTFAEDVEGLEWGSSLTAFQSLADRRAMSYTLLVRGETEAEVPVQNYGVELRFRQQVLRRWLFMELSSSLTWPRELLTERREPNPGVGLGFEMYFGPVPDERMR
jgi:hypothetical protein